MIKEKKKLKLTQNPFYQNLIYKETHDYQEGKLGLPQTIKQIYHKSKDWKDKGQIVHQTIEFMRQQMIQLNEIYHFLGKLNKSEKMEMGDSSQRVAEQILGIIEQYGYESRMYHWLYKITNLLLFSEVSQSVWNQIVLLVLQQIEQWNDDGVTRMAIQYVHLIITKTATNTKSTSTQIDPSVINKFRLKLMEVLFKCYQDPMVYRNQSINKLLIQTLKSILHCTDGMAEQQLETIIQIIKSLLFDDTQHRMAVKNAKSKIEFYQEWLQDNSTKNLGMQMVSNSDISDLEKTDNIVNSDYYNNKNLKIAAKCQAGKTLEKLIIQKQKHFFNLQFMKLMKTKTMSKEVDGLVVDQWPLILQEQGDQKVEFRREMLQKVLGFIDNEFREPSLLYFVIFERNLQVREAMNNVIVELMESVPEKLYLSGVDYQKGTKMNFQPIFQKVYNTIQQLFETIVLCLQLEDQQECYLQVVCLLGRLVELKIIRTLKIKRLEVVLGKVLMKVLENSFERKIQTEIIKIWGQLGSTGQYRDIVSKYGIDDKMRSLVKNELEMEEMVLESVRLDREDHYVAALINYFYQTVELCHDSVELYYETIEQIVGKVMDVIISRIELVWKQSDDTMGHNYRIYFQRLVGLIYMLDKMIGQHFKVRMNDQLLKQQVVGMSSMDNINGRQQVKSMVKLVLVFQKQIVEHRGLMSGIVQIVNNMSDQLIDDQVWITIAQIISIENQYSRTKKHLYIRFIGSLYFKQSVKQHLHIIDPILTSWLQLQFVQVDYSQQIQLSWMVANCIQSGVILSSLQLTNVWSLLVDGCVSAKEKIQSNVLRALYYILLKDEQMEIEKVWSVMTGLFKSIFNKVHQMIYQMIQNLLKMGNPKNILTVLYHKDCYLLDMLGSRFGMKSNNRLTMLQKVEAMNVMLDEVDKQEWLQKVFTHVEQNIADYLGRDSSISQIEIVLKLVSKIQVEQNKLFYQCLIQNYLEKLMKCISRVIYHYLTEELQEKYGFEDINQDDDQRVFNIQRKRNDNEDQQIIQRHGERSFRWKQSISKNQIVQIVEGACQRLEGLIEQWEDISLSMYFHDILQQFVNISGDNHKVMKLLLD